MEEKKNRKQEEERNVDGDRMHAAAEAGAEKKHHVNRDIENGVKEKEISPESYGEKEFYRDCESMNLSLNREQQGQFQRYYELLVEWNSFMNLTAITEYPEVLKKHFLDSLSLAQKIDFSGTYTLLDVGTGAGFPGIPLKIAFPELKVVLLDSLGKRVKFLNHVIQELGLRDISAIHGRAEDFAREKDYRESFDFVVSRAVANLSSLSEYCIPYTKMGGRFISYKSGKIEEELNLALRAISILGGKVEYVYKFSLDETQERSFVIVKKERPTLKKYPRKAGMPSREPL